jgi:RNA polymerase sigma factor (sigma-70 family)
VRKFYGYYDQETQEDIFWRGMAFIWENLGEFDESKSKFNTWIWLQVKYGSRNALRKEIRAKQLRVKCENNPALLVEELSIINKKGGSVPTSSLDSLLGREIGETTKQESKVLKSVFEVLSEKDRMLIDMKVSQMLSIEEIVSLLGPPANINQVSVAISRALKRAQNLYIEKMAEERAER